MTSIQQINHSVSHHAEEQQLASETFRRDVLTENTNGFSRHQSLDVPSSLSDVSPLISKAIRFISAKR